MFNYLDLVIAFLIAAGSTFLLTFPVKKLAIKLNVVDFPNRRKIHTKVTPRLGGLAIFLGALLGILYLKPHQPQLFVIFLGAIIIIITGALDDRFSLRPVVKLSGQLLAASLLVSSGIIIERITLPFIGMVDLGLFSVLITILWIVGITNAINLIDGLDGLATGITAIALTSLFVMALLEGQVVVAFLCIVLIGANAGFLYHNFYPAKIYMGDSGSNFLGYMIAVISILGLYKNVAILGFLIPIIALAVPLFDTFLAIIRRTYNRTGVMQADNKHIHYRLLRNGYTHRQTVLIVYLFSTLFGLMAILFSRSGIGASFMITVIVVILLQIFAEMAGLMKEGRRPILDFIMKPFRQKPKSR